MWSQIAELDTKLVISLQGSKAVTLSLIFSTNQKSFLPLQEKKKLFASLSDNNHLCLDGFQQINS